MYFASIPNSFSRPEAGPSGVRGADPSPETVARVDAVEDELMAVESAEGRPTPHWLSRVEWKWAGVGMLVVVGVGVGLAASGIMSVETVMMVAGGAVLFFFAAAPAWGAGLLRRGEKRRARREAEAVLGVERTK